MAVFQMGQMPQIAGSPPYVAPAKSPRYPSMDITKSMQGLTDAFTMGMDKYKEFRHNKLAGLALMGDQEAFNHLREANFDKALMVEKELDRQQKSEIEQQESHAKFAKDYQSTIANTILKNPQMSDQVLWSYKNQFKNQPDIMKFLNDIESVPKKDRLSFVSGFARPDGSDRTTTSRWMERNEFDTMEFDGVEVGIQYNADGRVRRIDTWQVIAYDPIGAQQRLQSVKFNQDTPTTPTTLTTPTTSDTPTTSETGVTRDDLAEGAEVSTDPKTSIPVGKKAARDEGNVNKGYQGHKSPRRMAFEEQLKQGNKPTKYGWKYDRTMAQELAKNDARTYDQLYKEYLTNKKLEYDLDDRESERELRIKNFTNDYEDISRALWLTENLTKDVKRFEDSVGWKLLSLDYAAGIVEEPFSGTGARDFEHVKKQLVALMQFLNIEKIKGQGSVTDRERQWLMDAYAGLDSSVSEKQFKRDLEAIKSRLERLLKQRDVYMKSKGDKYKDPEGNFPIRFEQQIENYREGKRRAAKEHDDRLIFQAKVTSRLEDVKIKYGADSKQYKNAVIEADKMLREGK